MDIRQPLVAVAFGVLTLAVVALGGMHITLRSQVAELSARLDAQAERRVRAPEGSLPVRGSGPPPDAPPLAATPAGALSDEPPPLSGVDEEELEALVHRTLEQQTKEREAAQAAQWADQGERWTERFVGELVAEGVVPAAEQEPVITVLVNEMHDGIAMKARFGPDGDPEAAWVEWQAMVADNDARLAELIGEEATAALRERTGAKR